MSQGGLSLGLQGTHPKTLSRTMAREGLGSEPAPRSKGQRELEGARWGPHWDRGHKDRKEVPQRWLLPRVVG